MLPGYLPDSVVAALSLKGQYATVGLYPTHVLNGSCAGGFCAVRKMIFQVYGKCTKGLEEDRLAIFRYFGRDFKHPGKTKAPATWEVPAKAGAFNPYLPEVVMFLWSGIRDSKTA